MSNMSLFDHPRSAQEQNDRVFSVSEVNRAVRVHLETGWPSVRVRGELSDVMHARSGHVYFTLNDSQEPAQIRAVMFRADAQRAKDYLRDAQCVQVTGMLSLYEARGGFQLIVRRLVPEGEGDAKAQFERLRRKLEDEGLIDPDKRRPLPLYPQVLGVVTSAEGAAIHDIIRVASNRFAVRLVLCPCLVQGSEAPSSIIAALKAIQRVEVLDVVIVGRGGGSAEDLAAFNDERVARAIAACRVPIVSAVGHEVDVTIADLVADCRASTPSNAAELVVPDKANAQQVLDSNARRLWQSMDLALGKLRLRLERLMRRFADPRGSLRHIAIALDQQHTALVGHVYRYLNTRRARLDAAHSSLLKHDVRRVLMQRRARLEALDHRLVSCSEQRINQQRVRLSAIEGRMRALSPLNVLARGYAVAIHEKTGKALLSDKGVADRDRLRIRLHEGTVKAVVDTSQHHSGSVQDS